MSQWLTEILPESHNGKRNTFPSTNLAFTKFYELQEMDQKHAYSTMSQQYPSFWVVSPLSVLLHQNVEVSVDNTGTRFLFLPVCPTFSSQRKSRSTLVKQISF